MTHAWTGRYATYGSTSDADCVIGFSFGYRGNGRHVAPGFSNDDLADVAIKHYPRLPKILQFEIADAYVAAGGPFAKRITRIAHHRVAHRYLDTHEVAAQAKIVMERHGWKTAILLADPYHMPRVQAVCNKLEVNWVATNDTRGAVEFDLKSTQNWTRSLAAWRHYEPMALMFYRLRGWV